MHCTNFWIKKKKLHKNAKKFLKKHRQNQILARQNNWQVYNKRRQQEPYSKDRQRKLMYSEHRII